MTKDFALIKNLSRLVSSQLTRKKNRKYFWNKYVITITIIIIIIITIIK